MVSLAGQTRGSGHFTGVTLPPAQPQAATPTLATIGTVVWDLSAETGILATDLTGLKAHSLST